MMPRSVIKGNCLDPPLQYTDKEGAYAIRPYPRNFLMPSGMMEFEGGLNGYKLLCCLDLTLGYYYTVCYDSLSTNASIVEIWFGRINMP